MAGKLPCLRVSRNIIKTSKPRKITLVCPVKDVSETLAVKTIENMLHHSVGGCKVEPECRQPGEIIGNIQGV